jgi:hypothetical protein
VFDVAQRGAGPFTTNGISYTLDRWATNYLFDTMSMSQVSLSDTDRSAIGDESALKAAQIVFTGTSAQPNARTGFLQRVENVYRLAGKTVTVSFWAKASSGTPKVGISIDQNFGTGGSPSSAVVGAGSAVTIGTTWARYQHTFTVPSVSGKTVGTNGDHNTQLNLWLSAGGSSFSTAGGGIGAQSNTVQLWGVQLEQEQGTSATALEYRDPVDELQRCQRFYQTGTAYGVASGQPAGTAFRVSCRLPVTMRTFPIVTPVDSTGSANLGTVTASAVDTTTVTAGGLSIATGQTSIVILLTIAADL